MDEPTGSQRLTYRLRPDTWDEICRRKAWTTQDAAADALNVSRPTVSRIVAGKNAPGPAFMAHLMAALHGWRHEELFEIVPRPERKPASDE